MIVDDISVNNILFSCDTKKKYADEQVVVDHALGLIVSGKLEMHFANQKVVSEVGNIGLIRRNELVKVLKIPGDDGRPFKAINIFLTQDILREYALQNKISKQEKYVGPPIIDLTQNRFIRAYWDSLLPYFNEPGKFSPKMAQLKTNEAIELLLSGGADVENFLFDLSEPHKIDLEKFMNKNFIFNVSISEFARVTGRSLSTFKRDFKKIFDETPEKWLRNKRLEEAKYLLKEKHMKPVEVYYIVGFENFSHFSDSFKKRFRINASSLC
ncbi:helix-turn-helix domain-containing protein [Maribellus maritimus]|uniref:helix-turn-helix domain-containing protein n=1 Tax=Maribellus maritimus TaxID=2870838 RepID=UPI001EEBCE79|nr:AraC family transcriptional regulator [Maribellus maritimus]MCG6188677.1 AraC family transcriptional regulator [Maribellus maritimus]